jgi:hypothetical protein
MQTFALDSVGRHVVVSIATILFVACVPIPRTVTLTPSVVGALLRDDGTPIVGERLSLSIDNDSTCVTPASVTITDAEGNFEFAAIRRREPYTLVLFDRVFCYNVCGRQGEALHYDCFMLRVPPTDFVLCVESSDSSVDDVSRVRCRPGYRDQWFERASEGSGSSPRTAGARSLRGPPEDGFPQSPSFKENQNGTPKDSAVPPSSHHNFVERGRNSVN